MAGILDRMKRPTFDPGCRLQAKAIDLWKAYKQLPLSEESLRDAHICVANPDKMFPEVFASRVLPFGAKAAVQAFCRSSHALWAVGVVLFLFHWTVCFDDFFLVESAEQSRYTAMISEAFFDFLGWETREEKDAGFLTTAKVLGVCVDLTDCHLGLVAVFNTEQRKSELCCSIDTILEAGVVGKGELPTLRGRLSFAENQIFGRLRNSHMKTVSRHAELDCAGKVDGDLSDALKLLRDRIVLDVSAIHCKHCRTTQKVTQDTR